MFDFVSVVVICLLFLLYVSALGVPASDYVMAGRIPVSKLNDLSVPLESPGKEAMTLLYRKG